MSKRHEFTATQIDEFVSKYNSGESFQKIANSAGCALPTMVALLKRNGVVARPKGRPKTVKTDVVNAEVDNSVEVDSPEDTEARLAEATKIFEASKLSPLPKPDHVSTW